MSERFRERPVGLSPCVGDGRAVLEVDDRSGLRLWLKGPESASGEIPELLLARR